MPVTVNTRIGWGRESEMPIVELAKRLDGVGVRALTVRCRTAKMERWGLEFSCTSLDVLTAH